MSLNSETEPLAALFFLGLLTPEEEVRLQERAKWEPAIGRMLNEYAEASSAIAMFATPVAPPAGVRESLLASLAPPREGFRTIGKAEGWQDHAISGVTFKQLSADDHSVTILFRLAPETVFPPHLHQGRETCYVVEGSYRTAGREFRAGDYVVAAAGTSDEEIRTDHGATLLVVMAAADFYAA